MIVVALYILCRKKFFLSLTLSIVAEQRKVWSSLFISESLSALVVRKMFAYNNPLCVMSSICFFYLLLKWI